MSSPTVESALRLDPRSGAAADIDRRRVLLKRWRRRSALIHALRRILPGLAAAMVLGLVGWAAVNTVYRRLSADRRGGSLAIHMLKASFEGRDDQGKPFLIDADSAVRDDDDPNRIVLENPVFTLGAGPPDLTKVRSRHGVYRDDSRMLDLTQDVHMDDAQGYHFVTEHALVDTRKSNVDGDKPVAGQGPLGHIVAMSYAVRDNGAHVYFYGHVKAHLVNGGVTTGRSSHAAGVGAARQK
jgi:lipopolysaccharide export system protein LptC